MEKVRPRRGGGQASRRAVTRCAATAQPPVTVESVAHLGPPSPLTLKDIARAGAHLWRSAEDLGHAPPRAVSTVHTAATALGERSEFFSARHPQFNDDLAELLTQLLRLTCSAALPDAFKRAGRLLEQLEHAGAEWIFEALDIFGLAILREPPDVRTPDVLPELRHHAWQQIECLYRQARSTPEMARTDDAAAQLRARRDAAAQLRQLGKVLAGDGRGHRRGSHPSISVHLLYVVALYRYTRAFTLLRAWRCSGSRLERIELVAAACDIAPDELRRVLRADAKGRPTSRPWTLKAAARVAAAAALHITEQTVKNVVSAAQSRK